MNKIQLFDEQIAKRFALLGLQNNVLKVQTLKPFTWKGNWKSPLYFNGREIPSYPEMNDEVGDMFVNLLAEHYLSKIDVIAGVATGAIAIPSQVAKDLGFPFVYVLPEPKGHGAAGQIAGVFEKGKRYLVMEDLFSKGGSSRAAADAIEAAGGIVAGVIANMTWGFKEAENTFASQPYPVHVLSDREHLLAVAHEQGYIAKEDREIVNFFMNNHLYYTNFYNGINVNEADDVQLQKVKSAILEEIANAV